MQLEHLHGNNGQDEDSCPACTGLFEVPFEAPQCIDTTQLKASISGIESLRLELMAEHFQTCEGFVLVDAGLDSEHKAPCDICWPDGFVEPDRDGEDR